ncbi:MAG: RsmB/NOP family class I SAM-dependent RNA methyltransferase [Verrucomicrobiota bacterium]
MRSGHQRRFTDERPAYRDDRRREQPRWDEGYAPPLTEEEKRALWLPIAAKIIGKCSRDLPADAALREAFRESEGITRTESRAISQAVFAYFRWLGWLHHDWSIQHQISQAQELEEKFRTQPNAFSATDLRRAIPEWIQEQLSVTPGWLRALQQPPTLWLRSRKTSNNSLQQRSFDAKPGPLPQSISYSGSLDLFRLPEFQAGEFEVQDLSSQAVSLICAPKSGETWWDVCAGEGGKTLHLAELMGNKGLIWATDKAEWRLRRLKMRAKRAQCFNYRSRVWDGSAKLPFGTKMDGILVDAPCSGVGTWQRNPHARWTTTELDVRELAALQGKILNHAVAALKPGGRLIYSVCTLTRGETTEVAAAFSTAHPELKPLPVINPLKPKMPPAETLWISPAETSSNGMFIAVWERTGGAESPAIAP